MANELDVYVYTYNELPVTVETYKPSRKEEFDIMPLVIIGGMWLLAEISSRKKEAVAET